MPATKAVSANVCVHFCLSRSRYFGFQCNQLFKTQDRSPIGTPLAHVGQAEGRLPAEVVEIVVPVEKELEVAHQEEVGLERVAVVLYFGHKSSAEVPDAAAEDRRTQVDPVLEVPVGEG